MGTFLVTLICHAELGVPGDDPGVTQATVFQEWIPRFTRLLDQIERDTGRRIPVTWCCCANHSRAFIDSGKVLCAQHFPDQWQALRDRGDEIGLHSHPPDGEGFDGCWSQDRFIEEDVEHGRGGFIAVGGTASDRLCWEVGSSRFLKFASSRFDGARRRFGAQKLDCRCLPGV